MKIIVTMIPSSLVASSLLSLPCPFIETKKKESNWQVGGLVTRNSFAYCL